MKPFITFSNLFKISFLIVALLTVSCEKEPVSEEINSLDLSAKASPAATKGESTIAEIVVSHAEDPENPQFTLLLAALNYAGITSMFTENDQYTVFAPTDAAFQEFLGDKSLTDFTPEQVAAVLSYHVTDGRRFSNSVVPKNSPREIETLLGPSIYVHPMDDWGNVYIDTNDEDMDPNASILIDAGLYNISASNGVIHVIDQVLVPITE